jgi:hypothetical protein
MDELIERVSKLLDNGIDAEGTPLTNDTEFLLRAELIGLNSRKYRLFGHL